MSTVDDGALGNGKSAGVGNTNRLFVAAQTISALDIGAIKGAKSLTLSSGLITLTSATESALLYLKNTDPARLIYIPKLLLAFGKSTGGPGGDVQVKCYANPTTGTLISAPTATPALVNRNLACNSTAQFSSASGAEAKTITNTTAWRALIGMKDQSQNSFDFGYWLGANNALALSVVPPAGNTSIVVSLDMELYYYDVDELV